MIKTDVTGKGRSTVAKKKRREETRARNEANFKTKISNKARRVVATKVKRY